MGPSNENSETEEASYFEQSPESEEGKNYMDKILNSINNSLYQKNWYAALFMSLTLPDICSSLEFGKGDGNRYSQWFENNLKQYAGFLSGDDCYALRCALLHQGKDDISDQIKRDVLEHYVFLTSGAHRNLFKGNDFNGVKKSFLQLNVGTFCKDMVSSVENWLTEVNGNSDIQYRLINTIGIHEPGYTHLGMVKFG